jgi:hypothetical protein
MTLLMARSWIGFFSGTLTGCWIGVVVGCGVTLLLMGRRVRQLETINLLLRSKIKVLQRPQRATGPALVMPRPSPVRVERVANSRAAQAH